MLSGLPFTFLSHIALAASATLALITIIIAAIRRPDMPRSSQILIALGLVLFTLGAGQLAYLESDPREVIVMVDLSPSTRSAQYRDAKVLQQRISTLLHKTPHRIVYFSDDNRTQISPSTRLPDLPSDKTIFNPPPAAAILLFSDARFDLPNSAPPIFIAVDPLDNPPDASIKQLEIKNQILSTTISNSSTQNRNLQSPTTRPIPPGSYILTDPLPKTSLITARLNPADDWPENDQLTIRPPAPILTERWWIGPNLPANFKSISNLPTDSGDYLTPSIIILNNTPASNFSDLQLQRLQQYIRDLGGSLIIVGGDHAFAAGGYQGTILDALSPLASSPPTPTLHWLLLADSSGSMSASVGPTSRFELSQQSILSLLPHLPPEDPVSIGSFAENLHWWSTGKSANETTAISFPKILPTGPTNLEPAIQQIISESKDTMPKELLILTDADTKIENIPALETGLKQKQIRLSVLVIGQDRAQGLAALQQLSKSTGGQILTELDPKKWTAATQKLFSTISPPHLMAEPTTIKLANLPARQVTPWNRTWLKKDATALADASLAAQWHFGSGTVAAFSFPANTDEIESLSKLIAQPPRDPRFQITWTQGPQLTVRIDATDGQKYLNNENLILQVMQRSFPIPQTAPGRYELAIDAPTQTTFATILHESRILDRISLPGRYPPEFDAIGNDERAMKELAFRTGGAVISPTDNRSIQFDFPRRHLPLSSALATAAALSIALGLILRRLR